MNSRINHILFIILIIGWLIVAAFFFGPYALFEKYIWKPHLRFSKKTKEEMK